MPPMDPSAVLTRRERLVTRDVEGDTLVVPLAGRPEDLTSIFIFNPVGAFVWKTLDGARTVAELNALVCAEFDEASPEAVSKDVAEFLGELDRLGLIALQGAAHVASLDPSQ
jgi:hypothetical protein